MNSVSAEEMRAMDQYAIQVIGIPGIILMEHAAMKITKHLLNESFQKIYIIAGTGNNGGDGLAVARQLFLLGKQVKVRILGDPEKGSPDFLTNFRILTNLAINMKRIISKADLADLEDQDGSAILLDAIFGTGLEREVTGLHREVIDWINHSGLPVISVDIPSGLDADTGKILGAAVQAKKVITLQKLKHGLVEYPGEVVVEDIGIPEKSILNTK